MRKFNVSMSHVGENVMKRIFVTVILFGSFYFFTNNLAAQETKIYHVQGDSIFVEALRERPIPKFSTVATKLDIELQKIPLSVGVVNNSLITIFTMWNAWNC